MVRQNILIENVQEQVKHKGGIDKLKGKLKKVGKLWYH